MAKAFILFHFLCFVFVCWRCLRMLTPTASWAGSVFADANKCVDRVSTLRPVVACLPCWFRFAQCLRRYRDTKEAFPHLANAAKYSTTFFVLIFSSLHFTYKSKFFLAFFSSILILREAKCENSFWRISQNGFLWVQLKHIVFGKRFNCQKELTAHVLLYLFKKGFENYFVIYLQCRR